MLESLAAAGTSRLDASSVSSKLLVLLLLLGLLLFWGECFGAGCRDGLCLDFFLGLLVVSLVGTWLEEVDEEEVDF